MPIMQTVAALYQFKPIDDAPALVEALKALTDAAQTVGTLLVAPEGINGT
ncbi:MAG: hypothetical protein HWE20_12300, partial [Gammaproteobacteria bacterium]|nr:hypothetical protein [Gammaproteobacteria bacterium]